MKIKIVGRITDVNVKEGMAYVTMLDTEEGGLFKVSIPANSGLVIDQKVNLEAICKPGISNYGLYLKVVSLVSNKTEVKEK
jgi:hypothetical protein